MKEIWRPIQGYEGRYEVSSLGRVKSLKRPYAGERILKPSKRHGYLSVSLHCGEGAKSYVVHGLVAQAFLGPRPEGLVILHGPGGKEDNRPENLSYGTQAQNIADKLRDGTLLKGERHGRALLTEPQAIEILRRAESETLTSLAAEFGVSRHTVSKLVNRKNWAHLHQADYPQSQTEPPSE